MNKKLRMIGLSLILLFTSVSIPFPSIVNAGVYPTTEDQNNPNIHYFVSMGYYDIWQYANGDWTKEGSPGQPKIFASGYDFDFPSRKIKSVKVEKFNPAMPNGEDIFYTSRYGEMEWKESDKWVSTSYSSIIQGNISGIGTDSVSFDIEVDGILSAFKPLSLDEGREDLDEEVVGSRYYFPSLVTIELEPLVIEGTAYIRHYTSDGESLDSTFGNYDQTMIEGGNYTFNHSNHTDYDYVGYKMQEESVPSGGSTSSGDPPAIDYDGSYDRLYIFHYYELINSGGGNPPDPSEPNSPIADFRYSPSSPNAEENVNFYDQSSHPDHLDIITWRWEVDGSFFSNEQDPQYEFPEAGLYDVKLTVTDENGKSDNVKYTVSVDLPNDPPSVRIRGEDEVYLGDTESYYVTASDPDGHIASHEWGWSKNDAEIFILDQEDERIKIEFLKEGTFDLWHGVTDNRGESAEDIMEVTVLSPIPEADINATGSFKVNRKITIDSLQSWTPSSFPIDESKTKWTITPLDNQESSSIKYLGTLIGEEKDTLFKEDGEYKITLYIENSAGYSDTDEVILNVYPDEPAIADYTAPLNVLRDPDDNNHASLEFMDQSYSPDGDNIVQRLWEYTFDSNNDGSIDDEDWYIFSDGNELELTLRKNHVGEYHTRLTVSEEIINDSFIQQFVTQDEVISISEEKTTEIMNIAPEFRIEVQKTIPDVQLVFPIGNSQYTEAEIQSSINNILLPSLSAQGIDYDIVIENNGEREIEEVALNISDYTTRTMDYLRGVASSGRYYVLDGYYYSTVADELFSYKDSGKVLRNSGRMVYFWNQRNSDPEKDAEELRYRTFTSSGQSDYDDLEGSTKSSKYGYVNYKTWAVNDSGDHAIEVDQDDDNRFDSSHRDGVYSDYSQELLVKMWVSDLHVSFDADYIWFRPESDFGDKNDIWRANHRNPDPDSAINTREQGDIIKANSDYVYYLDYNAGALTQNLMRMHSDTFEVEFIADISDKTGSDYQVDEYDNYFYYETEDFILTRINLDTKQKEVVIDTTDIADTYVDYWIDENDIYVFDYVGQRLLKVHKSESVDLLNILKTVDKKDDTEMFVMPIDDEEILDLEISFNEVISELNDKQAYYMPFGTSKNQDQHERVLSNVEGGTYFNNSSLDVTMQNLADDIIARLVVPPSNEIYITLDEEIEYLLEYSDRENDRQDFAYYRYDHDPYVFDNSQGISMYDGYSSSTPLSSFDKKGLYTVSGTAQDNPAFSELGFAEYKLWSEEEIVSVYVHERPKALFSYELDYRYSRYYITFDSSGSYDPDHVISRSDKGIAAESWRWKEKDGEWNIGQPEYLERNTEYIIQLKVQDIEGAWSEPFEIEIDTADRKPNAGFTITPTRGYIDSLISITSTASPGDEGETLTYEYYISINGSESLKTTDANWSDTFPLRETYTVRQVVEDSRGDTDESIETFEIVNRAPNVSIIYPYSLDQYNPTKIDTTTPSINWSYSDNDGDIQQKYNVKIYQYGGILYTESGENSSSSKSWTTPELPKDVNLYAVVQSFDGFDWSTSDVRFFTIETNQVPVADFNWSPNPTWEGDTVTLNNLSSDPDGDDLIYNWSIEDPNGNISNSMTQNPKIEDAIPGTYNIELIVTDPDGENDSITKNVIVNAAVLNTSISHIQEWIDYYNDNSMNLSTFLAGEPFEIFTSTMPEASSVTVDFKFPYASKPVPIHFLYDPNDSQYPNFAHNFNLTSTDQINWEYVGWRKYWIQVPDGVYEIGITVVYENGLIKTNTEFITINGHILEHKKESYSNIGY